MFIYIYTSYKYSIVHIINNTGTTIHKSQGASYSENVVIAVCDIRQRGQAYVALSRATAYNLIDLVYERLDYKHFNYGSTETQILKKEYARLRKIGLPTGVKNFVSPFLNDRKRYYNYIYL